jgi:hypothetical protein
MMVGMVTYSIILSVTQEKLKQGHLKLSSGL